MKKILTLALCTTLWTSLSYPMDEPQFTEKTEDEIKQTREQEKQERELEKTKHKTETGTIIEPPEQETKQKISPSKKNFPKIIITESDEEKQRREEKEKQEKLKSEKLGALTEEPTSFVEEEWKNLEVTQAEDKLKKFEGPCADDSFFVFADHGDLRQLEKAPLFLKNLFTIIKQPIFYDLDKKINTTPPIGIVHKRVLTSLCHFYKEKSIDQLNKNWIIKDLRPPLSSFVLLLHKDYGKNIQAHRKNLYKNIDENKDGQTLALLLRNGIKLDTFPTITLNKILEQSTQVAKSIFTISDVTFVTQGSTLEIQFKSIKELLDSVLPSLFLPRIVHSWLLLCIDLLEKTTMKEEDRTNLFSMLVPKIEKNISTTDLQKYLKTLFSSQSKLLVESLNIEKNKALTASQQIDFLASTLSKLFLNKPLEKQEFYILAKILFGTPGLKKVADQASVHLPKRMFYLEGTGFPKEPLANAKLDLILSTGRFDKNLLEEFLSKKLSNITHIGSMVAQFSESQLKHFFSFCERNNTTLCIISSDYSTISIDPAQLLPLSDQPAFKSTMDIMAYQPSPHYDSFVWLFYRVAQYPRSMCLERYIESSIVDALDYAGVNLVAWKKPGNTWWDFAEYYDREVFIINKKLAKRKDLVIYVDTFLGKKMIRRTFAQLKNILLERKDISCSLIFKKAPILISSGIKKDCTHTFEYIRIETETLNNFIKSFYDPHLTYNKIFAIKHLKTKDFDGECVFFHTPVSAEKGEASLICATRRWSTNKETKKLNYKTWQFKQYGNQGLSTETNPSEKIESIAKKDFAQKIDSKIKDILQTVEQAKKQEEQNKELNEKIRTTEKQKRKVIGQLEDVQSGIDEGPWVDDCFFIMADQGEIGREDEIHPVTDDLFSIISSQFNNRPPMGIVHKHMITSLNHFYKDKKVADIFTSGQWIIRDLKPPLSNFVLLIHKDYEKTIIETRRHLDKKIESLKNGKTIATMMRTCLRLHLFPQTEFAKIVSNAMLESKTLVFSDTYETKVDTFEDIGDAIIKVPANKEEKVDFYENIDDLLKNILPTLFITPFEYAWLSICLDLASKILDEKDLESFFSLLISAEKESSFFDIFTQEGGIFNFLTQKDTPAKKLENYLLTLFTKSSKLLSKSDIKAPEISVPINKKQEKKVIKVKEKFFLKASEQITFISQKLAQLFSKHKIEPSDHTKLTRILFSSPTLKKHVAKVFSIMPKRMFFINGHGSNDVIAQFGKTQMLRFFLFGEKNNGRICFVSTCYGTSAIEPTWLSGYPYILKRKLSMDIFSIGKPNTTAGFSPDKDFFDTPTTKSRSQCLQDKFVDKLSNVIAWKKPGSTRWEYLGKTFHIAKQLSKQQNCLIFVGSDQTELEKDSVKKYLEKIYPPTQQKKPYVIFIKGKQDMIIDAHHIKTPIIFKKPPSSIWSGFTKDYAHIFEAVFINSDDHNDLSDFIKTFYQPKRDVRNIFWIKKLKTNDFEGECVIFHTAHKYIEAELIVATRQNTQTPWTLKDYTEEKPITLTDTPIQVIGMLNFFEKNIEGLDSNGILGKKQ